MPTASTLADEASIPLNKDGQKSNLYASPSQLPTLFALLKIVLHLSVASAFGFHRDELLYLALGRHLDWGYWSNPPFIGFVSWCTQHALGDSLWATRLPSALAGGALVWLAVRMARELGGGAWAQVLCGVAMLVSPTWLRMNAMLQPVPFDVLFWTLGSFCVLRWINTRDPRWWWAMGIAVGIGFLNKYTLVFWVIGLIIALLCTPERKVLLTRAPWQAAGLALLLILPNLIWQWAYCFPVIHHMEELTRNQLDLVRPGDFLRDQLILHGPGLLLWAAGLLFLLTAKRMRPYRILGWFYLAVLFVFLALGGKSYYTAGTYPVLLAAGGVCWENLLRKRWLLIGLAGVLLAAGLPFVPAGIPLYSGEKAVAYFHWLAQDLGLAGGVRWEDGELHPLPQDFADMLGWEEIGQYTDTAILRANAQGATPYMVYGENYGEVGAADCFAHQIPDTVPIVSFADAWRLWAPDTIPARLQTLVYINDEPPGADIQPFFYDVQLIGKVENPLAREYGTGVWLCKSRGPGFAQFWKERVRGVKQVFNR